MADPHKAAGRAANDVVPAGACPADLSRLSIKSNRDRIVRCRENGEIDVRATTITGRTIDGHTLYSIAQRLRLNAANNYRFPPPSQELLVKELRAQLPKLGERALTARDTISLAKLPSLKIYHTPGTPRLKEPKAMAAISDYHEAAIADRQDLSDIDPTKKPTLRGKDLKLQTVYSIARRLSSWLESKEVGISHFELQRDIEKYCLHGKKLEADDTIDLRKIPSIKNYLATLHPPAAARPAVDRLTKRAPAAAPVPEPPAEPKPLTLMERIFGRGLQNPSAVSSHRYTYMRQDDVAKLANMCVEQLAPSMELSKEDKASLKRILVQLAKKESSLRPLVVNANKLDTGLCQLNPSTTRGLLFQYGNILESTLDKKSPFRTVQFFGAEHGSKDGRMGIRFDPEINMKLAALYLCSLKSGLQSQQKGSWENALLGFRHGPGILQKHFDDSAARKDPHTAQHAAQGWEKELTYSVISRGKTVKVKWEHDYAAKVFDMNISDVQHLLVEGRVEPSKIAYAGAYVLMPKPKEEKGVKRVQGVSAKAGSPPPGPKRTT